MVKISQLPTDSAPTVTDSVPAVDIETLQTKQVLFSALITLFFANIPANVITSAGILWTTAGGIWWQEMARATASSTVADLTTSAFTAKKYLRILATVIPTGSAFSSGRIRFNADTASNYAYRISDNGAADATGTTDGVPADSGGGSTSPHLLGFDVVSITAQEKQVWGSIIDNVGAGTANLPRRREVYCKWVNTSAQITAANLHSAATNMASGSEIIVLGHD